MAIEHREQWPLERLKPYERNSRTHSPHQIEQIAKSIARFGFTIPILIDPDGGIIAGHGRLQAAKQLGMPTVPVIIAAGWSDAEKRAYIIADNQLPMLAGWDETTLQGELLRLQQDDFDLSLLGFDTRELTRLLDSTSGASDPDDAPPKPATPTTRPGEIITMGRHQLLCGDATNPSDVASLLQNRKPHLMVTDPPYGVDYDPEWRNERARNSESMGNRCIGAGAIGLVTNDDNADWQKAYDLFPGDVAYVWHASLHTADFERSLKASRFEMRAMLIWSKSNFAIGRGHYHWQHEPCWYAIRKNRPSHWCGDRTQKTVWDIDKPQASETGHSTQKPVECMQRPIENNSDPGDHVYDPFVGSGTTIIAAEQIGRRCLAIELDPLYCDVAVLRWQTFTGLTATVNGQKYTDLQRERAPDAIEQLTGCATAG
jgi:DNA modification methylase